MISSRVARLALLITFAFTARGDTDAVALLRGRVIADKPPASLTIALRSGTMTTEVMCAIEEGQFECAVPAGVFDLRIKSRGYIPHFRWGVALRAGHTTLLEPMKFVAGAALTGYVQLPKTHSTVKIHAKPVPGSVPFGAQARVSALALTAVPNAKGFFAIDGIPPGDYDVVAEAGELVSFPRRVRVIHGVEAELAKALVLLRPEAVGIAITPPVDPNGAPWHAQIRDASGDVVGAMTVGSNGVARFTHVVPGDYRIVVISNETHWADEALNVTPSMPQTQIRIPLTAVRGTLHAGERPLEATLQFGGAHSSVSVPIRSNGEGEFAGVLPHGGDWIVEVASTRMHVEVKDAQLLDIKIPANHVAGQVLLDGAPVPTALVTLRAADAVSQVNAGDDGSFEFQNVTPGRIELRAEHHGGFQSDVVSETLADDASLDDVALDLRSSPYLEGVVVSGAGPVPGATVYAFSLSDRDPNITPVACSADGRFRVRLSPGTRDAGVLVAAAGFAFRCVRVGVTGEPVTIALAQDGGGLALAFTNPPSKAPVIVHGGVPIYFGVASAWSTAQGGEIGDKRAVIANFEPGDYIVCMPTRRVDTLALWSGQRPADQCVSGILAPHGELRVTVPVE